MGQGPGTDTDLWDWSASSTAPEAERLGNGVKGGPAGVPDTLTGLAGDGPSIYERSMHVDISCTPVQSTLHCTPN